MKKLISVLGIALMLASMFTMTALATKPAEIVGYFYNFVPGEYPSTYCLATFDGLVDGCVFQPYHEGLAAKGTFTGSIDGKYGTCEYNLRTFDIDGIARFAMNRCTGDLAGFHMQGTTAGMEFGLWKGYWHVDP
jgi:hypothetical protein